MVSHRYIVATCLLPQNDFKIQKHSSAVEQRYFDSGGIAGTNPAPLPKPKDSEIAITPPIKPLLVFFALNVFFKLALPTRSILNNYSIFPYCILHQRSPGAPPI